MDQAATKIRADAELLLARITSDALESFSSALAQLELLWLIIWLIGFYFHIWSPSFWIEVAALLVPSIALVAMGMAVKNL